MATTKKTGRPRPGAGPEPNDHPPTARTGTGPHRLTRPESKKKTPSAARAGRGSEGGAPERGSSERPAQELCSECPCFASWDVAGVLFCGEHCPRPIPARTPVRRVLLWCACGAEATVSPPGYADPIVCVACAGRAFGETKPSPSDAQPGGGPRGGQKKESGERLHPTESHQSKRGGASVQTHRQYNDP